MGQRIKLIILTSILIFTSDAFACSYPGDTDLTARQNKCNNDTSSNWDCSLNRCITTSSGVQKREDYKACQSIENKTSQKKCFDDYAKNNTKIKNAKGPNNNINLGVSALYTTLMSINAFGDKSAGGIGGCTSKMIFSGTAVAGVLSEAYFRLFAADTLKSLEKKYEKKQIDDPYTAQKEAFEYLIKEQKAIKSMAKNRKTAYLITSVGYTAAAGFAVYESFFGGASCAVAEGAGLLGNYANSYAILAYATVGAGVSFTLSQQAGVQSKKSSENIEKIEAILVEFKDTVAGHCPAGRTSLSEPRCYCYLDDGSKNSSRDNSDTCKALWQQDDLNLYDQMLANNPKSTVPAPCMTVNLEFDKDCKCKKFINDGGQNACHKTNIQTGNISESNLANSLAIPSVSAAQNSIFQGNTGSAELAGADLSNAAIKSRKTLNTLLDKAKTLGKLPNTFDRDLKGLQTKLLKENLNKFRADANSIALPKTSFGNIKAPSSVAKAIAATKTRLEAKSKTPLFKNDAKKEISSSKKNAFSFRLDSSDPANAKVIELGEEQEGRKLNINDINSNNEVSIFKLISKRYITSGLERLFGK